MKSLVMATCNQGKVAELRAALEGLGFEIRGLVDVAPNLEVEEDADTFEGNAIKKAVVISEALGRAAVADDSGLEVDALGGAPGVRSARYGGEGLSDAQRCDILLKALTGVPDEHRTARFQCVLALRLVGEAPVCFSGTLEGRISTDRAGEHGFGYDPVFIPRGFDLPLAVLGQTVKQRISHRAQALRCLTAYVRSLGLG